MLRFLSSVLLVGLLFLGASRTKAGPPATSYGYPGAATFSGPQRCEESFTYTYGADSSGTNDCADAFAAFLASENEYLYIPAGTYYFDMGEQGSFEVDHDITITGAGEGQTTIVLGPDYPSDYYFWIEFAAPCAVSVQGLKIEGPAHPTYNTNIESSPWTIPFAIPARASSSPTSLTLDHVSWANVAYAISSSSGGDQSPTTVTITNCLGSAWAQSVALFRGDTEGNLLTIRDSSFTRWGKGPAGQSYGICLYVHDHVGLDIERCYFNNSAGPIYQFAIKYGSSGWGSTAPETSRIADSYFGTDGGIQLDGNARTSVTGTTVADSNAYLYFGDNGLDFEDCAITCAVVYGPSAGGDFTFTGCALEAGEWSWSGSTTIAVDGGEFRSLWKFYGATATDWTGTLFDAGHVYFINGNSGDHHFDGCDFDGTTFYTWNGSEYVSASEPECSTCEVE